MCCVFLVNVIMWACALVGVGWSSSWSSGAAPWRNGCGCGKVFSLPKVLEFYIILLWASRVGIGVASWFASARSSSVFGTLFCQLHKTPSCETERCVRCLKIRLSS